MSQQLCYQYLDALNRSDLEAVLSLFAEGARVVSPLYGNMRVEQFYKALFDDTERSFTRPVEVFEPCSGKPSVALQFKYEWTMSSGSVVVFDCVDLFELNEARTKFIRLTIVYDTYPIRDAFTTQS